MPNPIESLPLWVQIAAAAMLVVGGVFTLVGAVGMVRFGDFFMRLHAPTKASTLGVGGVLLASLLVSWAQGFAGLQVLLITLFVFITAPVSANLLGMAGLHLRLPSKAPLPQDQVEP
jgi:multicomponent K+:H+ antiporter subunit G